MEFRLATKLLDWFERNRRPLPWRQDRDPYRIWVAEVLLQQTRVAQAVPYYERFITRFPTVDALARAPLAEVLKVWEGAGYYARARHLHAGARAVARSPSRALPRTVADLEELPGVGPYIARAIASLSYGTPVVALEANAVRVGLRWTADRGDPRRRSTRRRLEEALRTIQPAERAREFNEALMELGETVCHVRAPACRNCPVSAECRARQTLADPSELPRRSGRPARPLVRASVVVVSRRGRWFVQQRPLEGLLGGLWEFPGGKLEPGEPPAAAARREFREELGATPPPLRFLGTVRHGYSHFRVELHVYRADGEREAPLSSSRRGRWVTPGQFERLPRPMATRKIVRDLLGPGGTASRG